MDSSPLVSIVVPNYNSERFIGRTLQSVTDQSYSNWELLVVDDRSTDRGPDIVKKLADSDSRVKLFVMEKNSGGPAGPRNLGISHAKGEYICLLDSDDVWHPKKLEYQVKFVLENKLDFASTMRTVFTDDSEIKNEDLLYVGRAKVITYKKLLKKNYIVTASVIFKKEIIKNIKFNVDREYIAIEDYDFFLEILKMKLNLYIQRIPLVYYRITDQNISKNKFKMVNKVKKMLIAREGIIQGYYYFLFYLILSFIYIIKKR